MGCSKKKKKHLFRSSSLVNGDSIMTESEGKVHKRGNNKVHHFAKHNFTKNTTGWPPEQFLKCFEEQIRPLSPLNCIK